jgi:hypothetical protein
MADPMNVAIAFASPSAICFYLFSFCVSFKNLMTPISYVNIQEVRLPTSIIGPEAGGVTIGDQQSSLRSHPVPRAIAHIVSNSYASTRNATDRTDNHSYYWIIILDGAPRRRMLHPEGAVFIPTIGPQSEQVGIFSAHGMNSNSRLEERLPYIFTLLSRRAFPITDTELKLIAAAANMGLSKIPKNG